MYIVKAIFALVITVMLASCLPTATAADVVARDDMAAAAMPNGMPAHLAFGVASGPSTLAWMQESGVRWDMRYQYLSGGANTTTGWATWNPDGAFVTNYMNGSAAAGYLPVFTYYQILQSQPASGSGEAAKVFSNLNNPQTMVAYYADFKLLLDKARAFDRPVIVHIEPDLFGYMQQRVVRESNSAADIPVSVASSGFADAAGLPDTFQGFNWALLRMRDRIAPKVIMAAHVTHWSTGIDLGTNTNASLDLQSVIARTAAFHRTAGLTDLPDGIKPYDLLFFGPSDRDAGYYEVVRGDGGKRWWDTTNQTLPNFERYRQYIAGITAETGRPAVLWQVPIGNTRYRTVDNTDGHYQDNRVEYFLGGFPQDGHLQGFVDAGVVAILWGRGANVGTTYNDAKQDGVTNPEPSNGNSLTTTLADDDGGYLRMRVGRYYKVGKLALPR